MYLRTILKRDDEELIKRVYREQQTNPCPGDYAELVKEDFQRCNLDYNEDVVVNMKEDDYRSMVRAHIRNAAFTKFTTMQESHSKVKTIRYNSLEKQPYLVSPLFSNEDVGILSNLRSHTTRGIRGNFKNFYIGNTNCPLKCWPVDSQPLEDTQQHLLVCNKIQIKTSPTVACGKPVYDDIYESTDKQKEIVTFVKECLNIRNKIIAESSPPTSG